MRIPVRGSLGQDTVQDIISEKSRLLINKELDFNLASFLLRFCFVCNFFKLRNYLERNLRLSMVTDTLVRQERATFLLWEGPATPAKDSGKPDLKHRALDQV